MEIMFGASAYRKLAYMFHGALPSVKTLRGYVSPKFSPDCDGFSIAQFARLRATFCIEISTREKISLSAAQSRLQASPYVVISQDATSTRPTLAYLESLDYVIGFVHNNLTHSWKPAPLSTLNQRLLARDHICDNIEIFLVKLLRWPSIPCRRVHLFQRRITQRGELCSRGEGLSQSTLRSGRTRSTVLWL